METRERELISRSRVDQRKKKLYREEIEERDKYSREKRAKKNYESGIFYCVFKKYVVT